MGNLVEAVSEFSEATESKLNDIAASHRDLRATVSDIENRMVTGGAERYTKQEHQHHNMFRDYLRDPKGRGASRLHEFGRDVESKDIILGVNAAGGFGLPKVLRDRMDRLASTLCPWLDPEVLGAEDVTSHDYRAIVGLSEGTASRTTETGTRTATATPTFRERAMAWGEYHCYVQASEHAREDIVQLENFLVREFAAQITARLALDIVSGTGSSGQVAGIINTTPVTTADSASPQRNAAAIQYSPLLGATSPIRIQPGDVARCLGLFSEEYLLDPSFHIVMSTSTWRTLAGYSDEAPFLMPRNPTLYGLPVRFSGAVTAGYPVLAGAWKRGYALVARGPLAITLDDNVTNPGYIRWFARRRYGGTVAANNAVKAVRNALS